MKFVIVGLFLLGSCGIGSTEKSGNLYPRVITPLGAIAGSYETANGGRRYEAYKGIPYAQPPIGNLRFEVAKSISSPWSGVLMAKQFGSPCMQYGFHQRNPVNQVSGSEDCLYLNVFTLFAGNGSREANSTRTNRLPVIFFIPGGAFLAGNGNNYGPKYLLDRNVTLVTLNYRVGPLGFLSTEDAIVPGNMGLKDQVIAMRWVKDNIQFFGGDPSRITIIGHSAGGASMHYHCLTNLTVGLFQRGISLSGTALNPWALVENPLEKAKKLAEVVGCFSNNNQDMVNCLRSRPAHQIVGAVGEFTKESYYPSDAWGPSVEKGSGEFTFIDRTPVEIIASGDVQDLPWITGVVSHESLLPLAYYLADAEEVFEALNDSWEELAPYILYFKDTIPINDQTEVARMMKQHYLGKSPFGTRTFNQTVRMLSDRIFVYDTGNAASSQARVNKNPVHVYYFSYRGAHSVSESLSGKDENLGVCHGDDLRYVLDKTLDPTTTVRDREMQQVMIDLWVSFATNGTPDVGVDWQSLNQSQTDEFRYLHIAGPREMAMESASNFGEKNFWRNINFQENIL